MGPSRIAIVIDDEAQRRRFAAQVGAGSRIVDPSGGEELTNLTAVGAVDVIIAGVLNRNDEFLPSALRDIARTAPDVTIIGVFEPSRPSLDEAADLSREVPAMTFACRPGARFEYLLRLRTESRYPATFTTPLVNCIDRLPVYGAARSFALLQALHPSFAMGKIGRASCRERV